MLFWTTSKAGAGHSPQFLIMLFEQWSRTNFAIFFCCLLIIHLHSFLTLFQNHKRCLPAIYSLFSSPWWALLFWLLLRQHLYPQNFRIMIPRTILIRASEFPTLPIMPPQSYSTTSKYILLNQVISQGSWLLVYIVRTTVHRHLHTLPFLLAIHRLWSNLVIAFPAQVFPLRTLHTQQTHTHFTLRTTKMTVTHPSKRLEQLAL